MRNVTHLAPHSPVEHSGSGGLQKIFWALHSKWCIGWKRVTWKKLNRRIQCCETEKAIEFIVFCHTHTLCCFYFYFYLYVGSIFNVHHSNKIIISKSKSANLTTLLRTTENYNIVLHTVHVFRYFNGVLTVDYFILYYSLHNFRGIIKIHQTQSPNEWMNERKNVCLCTFLFDTLTHSVLWNRQKKQANKQTKRKKNQKQYTK